MPPSFCELPPAFKTEVDTLTRLLAVPPAARATSPQAEALLILCDEKFLAGSDGHYPPAIKQAVQAGRQRLEAAGVDWRSAAIEARYARINAIHQAVATEAAGQREPFSDKLDRIVTHKFWGMLIFVGIMALMFLSIFTFAQLPMDLLQGLFRVAGRFCGPPDSAGRSAGAGGQGRRARGGGGRGFSAANLPAVSVYRIAGGHRLHGAGGVFDGSLDEQSRIARQKFHSDAQFLCLRDSRHHGHAHHRDAQRPAGHHSGGAVDELFGAVAGLYAADRGLHYRRRR